MVLTVVSFIVVLGILVFFHELGHYWVARKNGIVVEEFGIGYPPRAVKLFTYDGTDFTLNFLPFGGFARMKGEDAGDLSPGSFNAASRLGRAATLAAGPFMNALLAIVLFGASFMAGFPAPIAYAQISSVADGSPAMEAGLQEGDLLLMAGGKPARVSATTELAYDVVESDEVAAGSDTDQLLISRDGEIISLPVQTSVSASQLVDDLTYVPVLMTEIKGVAEDSPAHLAGIQAGDLVYKVDDTVITAETPLNGAIQQALGTEVIITFLRGQEWVEIAVTPRVEPPPGQGSLGVEIGGISTLATLPLLPALREGVISTGQYIMLVLKLPVMILMGQLAAEDAQLSGPVGIAQMVGGAVSATIDTGLWFPILRLSAVLSAALAITNLLPLPALDGGRLLFIALEAIRGRRINPEREGMVHMVGFMLLLGLLVIVTVQDLRSAQEGIDWISYLGQ